MNIFDNRDSNEVILLKNTRATILQHNMISSGQRVVCGLSGGADSTALLCVMAELAEEMEFSICAAHLNHMLRAQESDGDERFAREICERFGIELFCERLDVSGYAAGRKIGIEQAARELRYDFFNRAARNLCADKIATAHTADDNLETIVFNLARGAGLRGMCGIPPVRGNIIRPIIYSERTEIIEYIKSRGLSFRTDSSNLSTDYTRNRIRKEIIPVIKGINPAAAKTAGRNSSFMRADEIFIQNAADKAFDKCVCGGVGIKIDALHKLDKAISSRVISKLYKNAGGKSSLSAEHIAIIFEFIGGDARKRRRISLPGGVTAETDGLLLWIVNTEQYNNENQTERIQTTELKENSRIQLDNPKILIECKLLQKKAHNECKEIKNVDTFYVNCDKIRGLLVVRSRKEGDFISLFPGKISKTLKKLMTEKKIPIRERGLIPVVADDSGIIGVYGFGANMRRAFDAEKPCLEIRFKPLD